MENKKKDEEKVEVRHTINAEETFTLAKDVYDLRSFIKNVYSNRAVIARRLNILTLSVSLIFTLAYAAYILFTGLVKQLYVQTEIVLYCLFGAYALLFATVVIITLCGARRKARNVKKVKKALSVFRFILRLVSVAIAIAAIALTGGESYEAKSIALDVALVVVSVICLIVQAIPLVFGGFGKLARWLLSPVKMKYRFSAVALEWYELTVTQSGESKSTKRVSDKYHDDIGRCLDNSLIPALGKKYVTAIKPATLLNVVEKLPDDDRQLAEGVLKSVFAYAAECGYVAFDPCRDLNFTGSIEEEEKPKKTVKQRLWGMGKKLGKTVLDKYIKNSTEHKEE